MAQSSQPTQVVYVERLPPSPSACRLAPGTSSRQPEPFCDAEWLNEEPDREKPFVRFCEGLRHNRCMAEIVWHRRETRRQTENTNVMPIALEGLLLLDKNWNAAIHRRLHAHHYLACALSFAPLHHPPQAKRLPKDVNRVRRKLTIGAHKPHLFPLGLRNERSIKRIMMMQRELP